MGERPLSADPPIPCTPPEPSSELTAQDEPRPVPGRGRTVWFAALVLAAGTGLRISMSLGQGHLPDLEIFADWTRNLVAHGLAGFRDEVWCNYPPLHILSLWGVGRLVEAVDPEALAGAALHPWLRIPACLADLLTAILLWVEGRRLMGSRAGLLAAGLYYLNPAVLYNSAYWGQVDSIHTLFVLGAVVALNRPRPAHVWAGAAAGLAVLQKLQSVAFLPLVLFDVYRWGRWSGLGRWVAGVGGAALLVMAPYLWTGTAGEALEQGYDVVGQYSKLSVNAWNLWYLVGPKIPDDSPPHALVEMVADGSPAIPVGASWWLRFTWRRIGLVLFGVALAGVLALYSWRYSPPDRALAAALSGLVFFAFLTEMHERYAHPVLALLPLWVIGRAWRERAFAALSIVLLLNLVAIEPVSGIGLDLAAVVLVLTALFGGALLFGAGVPAAEPDSRPTALMAPWVSTPPPSIVIRVFRWAAGLAAVVAAGLFVLAWTGHARRGRVPEGVAYLSSLTPVSARQGYGALGLDRSVEGGVLHLHDHYYLRGLATHAPSTQLYHVPEGVQVFKALVGMDPGFKGVAEAEVFVDGRREFHSGPMHAGDSPQPLEIPVRGARLIKLVTMPSGSKKGDHVVWALARFE